MKWGQQQCAERVHTGHPTQDQGRTKASPSPTWDHPHGPHGSRTVESVAGVFPLEFPATTDHNRSVWRSVCAEHNVCTETFRAASQHITLGSLKSLTPSPQPTGVLPCPPSVQPAEKAAHFSTDEQRRTRSAASPEPPSLNHVRSSSLIHLSELGAPVRPTLGCEGGLLWKLPCV